MTRFEFDPNKDAANFERHGVRLSEARRLWETQHIIVPSKRRIGEPRWAIIGKYAGAIYLAVFETRDSKVRLITFHRADRRWSEIYERYF